MIWRRKALKKFLIPLALGVALMVPAQAGAKTKHYVGAVSPAGSISFNVVQKKHSKKKSVIGFSFSGVPVTCAEGAKTAYGFISFPVKLSGGDFNISVSSSSTGATLGVPDSLFTGTIHLSGYLPIDPSGTGTDCDSGVLNWTAQRG
jgi:hypothetical protein